MPHVVTPHPPVVSMDLGSSMLPLVLVIFNQWRFQTLEYDTTYRDYRATLGTIVRKYTHRRLKLPPYAARSCVRDLTSYLTLISPAAGPDRQHTRKYKNNLFTKEKS